MALVVNRPDGGKDLVPAALVIERAAQNPRDEGASPALSNSAVQFGHQLILEAYVQTHVCSLAQKSDGAGRGSDARGTAGAMRD
jgi:hypothetical protein